MNYRDFEIAISPHGEGFNAQADSQYGRPMATFVPPYETSKAGEVLRAIEELVDSSIKEGNGPPQIDLEDVGQTLYEALTQGRIGQALNRAIGNVEGMENDLPWNQREGLRLRLVFSSLDYDYGSLLALPWELLWDPFTKDFLSTSVYSPVVRYLDSPYPIAPAEAKKVRMLVVDWTPENLPDLKEEEERQEIKKALADLPALDTQFMPNPQLGELRDKLSQDRINILHVIAHGGFDESRGHGVLALTDTRGQKRRVSGADLALQLKDCRRDLRLVFLNACKGATLPKRAGYSTYGGVASALVKGGVATAVAMQFSISNPAAIAFSSAFYKTLAEGGQVDTAVANGRLAILAERASSLEWITPVLFMRARNGRIFQVEGKTAQSEMPKEEKVYLAVRSAGDIGIEDDPEGDNLLDLRSCFQYDQKAERSYIKDQKLWNAEILPRLREFLNRRVEPGRLNRLGLPAQVSVAFAAGYILEAKRGLDLSIIQRSQRGTTDWRELRAPADTDESFWQFDNVQPREQAHMIGGFLTSEAEVAPGADVAVAMSVAREV
ncbi:MAG TPA: CHAT domain-containing protein, partial [Acidobacteriota bacterium]|nr:CHAT domain-containing protein [Acidobacteriota bacterium]